MDALVALRARTSLLLGDVQPSSPYRTHVEVRRVVEGLELSEGSVGLAYLVDAAAIILQIDIAWKERIDILDAIAWHIRGSYGFLKHNGLVGSLSAVWCELLEQHDGTAPTCDAIALSLGEAETYQVDAILDKTVDPLIDPQREFAEGTFLDWSGGQTPQRALTVLDFLARVRTTPSHRQLFREQFARDAAFSSALTTKLWHNAASLISLRYRDVGKDAIRRVLF